MDRKAPVEISGYLGMAPDQLVKKLERRASAKLVYALDRALPPGLVCCRLLQTVD